MSDTEEPVAEEEVAEEPVEEPVEEEEEAPPPPPDSAEEEEDEEEEEWEAEDEETSSHPRPKPAPAAIVEDDAGVNEAQEALAAARRKQTEQNDDQIQEYIAMRQELAAKMEEEIEELKAQVAERKIERAQEQEEMYERMRMEEERRKADEEERKAKAAEEKARRDARLKKNLGGAFHVPRKPAGKNFVVVKKDPEEAAAGPTGPVGPSKEELEQRREDHIASFMRKYHIDGLGADDLKEKIKEMHADICKIEAGRYDLEKRQERQDYDMRELEERERQKARQAALKKGLDAEEAAASKHPPKVQVQSVYDRQIDRRGYGERQTLFEKPPPERKPKVYHGTPRPPPGWGQKESEELENVRKGLEIKYQEVVKAEGDDAKPPVKFIPPVCPEKDAYEVSPEEEAALAAEREAAEAAAAEEEKKKKLEEKAKKREEDLKKRGGK